MLKIISFSLWGDRPKYTIGAIKNAEIAQKLYPDWICRYYIAKSVPSEIINKLRTYQNVEIIEMEVEGNWDAVFWRFWACCDSQIMISRDTDSRLTLREKKAVDEWLKSDKDFHIMRDHPFHSAKILGGMWGCRNGILQDIDMLIRDFPKNNKWQVDQNFLRDIVYAKVEKNSFIHDDFFNYEPIKNKFPSKRQNFEFVGEVINEDEKPNWVPRFFLFLATFIPKRIINYFLSSRYKRV